jgi:hypothetical protein
MTPHPNPLPILWGEGESKSGETEPRASASGMDVLRSGQVGSRSLTVAAQFCRPCGPSLAPRPSRENYSYQSVFNRLLRSTRRARELSVVTALLPAL